MKSNGKTEDHKFRWSVIQRDTFKTTPKDEVILRTNSAQEAITAFKKKHDTRVVDQVTGDIVARTDWVNDGSFPRWYVSNKLNDFVAMEEKGIALPDQTTALPGPDREHVALVTALKELVTQIDAGETADYRALQEHRVMRAARDTLSEVKVK